MKQGATKNPVATKVPPSIAKKSEKQLSNLTFKTGDIEVSELFRAFNMNRLSTYNERTFSKIFEAWSKVALTESEQAIMKLCYGSKEVLFKGSTEENAALSNKRKANCKTLEKAMSKIGESLKTGYLSDAYKVLKRKSVTFDKKSVSAWKKKVGRIATAKEISKIQEIVEQYVEPYERKEIDMGDLYLRYRDLDIVSRVAKQKLCKDEKERLDYYRSYFLAHGTTEGSIILDPRDLFDENWQILGIEYKLWKGDYTKLLKNCYKQLSQS